MAKQRLIMLFDGTWNDPEDQTNVYRISRCLHDYDGDMRQRFFYNAGVGTSKLERFRGGVFGLVLAKICWRDTSGLQNATPMERKFGYSVSVVEPIRQEVSLG